MDSKKYLYLGKMRREVDEWRRLRIIHRDDEADEASMRAVEWLEKAKSAGATRADVRRIVFSDREGAWRAWSKVV